MTSLAPTPEEGGWKQRGALPQPWEHSLGRAQDCQSVGEVLLRATPTSHSHGEPGWARVALRLLGVPYPGLSQEVNVTCRPRKKMYSSPEVAGRCSLNLCREHSSPHPRAAPPPRLLSSAFTRSLEIPLDRPASRSDTFSYP